MPQLVGPGVELLHVEQLQLGERVGFQRRLLQMRKLQGSVRIVLTRVSTVSPPIAPSAPPAAPATTGSQVHSAAQWATSTSAGPSCSRNSLAGWWRRSLVT